MLKGGRFDLKAIESGWGKNRAPADAKPGADDVALAIRDAIKHAKLAYQFGAISAADH
jgi:hypothetical protein